MNDQAPLTARLESAAWNADADSGRLLLEAAQRIAALTVGIHAHQQARSTPLPKGPPSQVDVQLWALLDGDR